MNVITTCLPKVVLLYAVCKHSKLYHNSYQTKKIKLSFLAPYAMQQCTHATTHYLMLRMVMRDIMVL